MQNKLSTTFLIVLSILLFSTLPPFVQGQTGPGLPSQTWRCLKWEKYKGDVKPGGINHHRATLTGDDFPTNQDIYIVGCVDTAEGLKCTSGNNDYDQTLGFGENNYTNLQNNTTSPLPYGFIVDGGSKRTLPDGKLEAIAASWTKKGTDHSFYAVWINEPDLTNKGEGTSLQYGTFQFRQDTSLCSAVRWDPYGRIFDSQSLEPLPNINISLLDQNKNRVLIPNNPQTTQADGSFNFLVEPGSYFLSPNFPAGYTFNTTPNLHPNYIKAYFDIYKPNDVIVEKAGQPEHRDIPLDPSGTSPFRSEATMITYGHLRLETEIKYEGKISHPLSLVSLYGEKSSQEIGKTTADKFGFWEIKVDSKEIPQDEGLIPKITKVDLTQSQTNRLLQNLFSKLTKNIFAQSLQTASKKVIFQPLLGYVEGYAYDNKGNPTPQAEVKVKLKMSNSVYYQTSADEKGHFIIPPQNLPIFEYYLEFQSPNTTKAVQKTTSEFAQKNSQYLTANRINLMTATKKSIPVVFSSERITTPPQRPKSSIINQSKNEKQEEVPAGSKTLIYVGLLLLTAAVIGGGIFIYLKKKLNTT